MKPHQLIKKLNKENIFLTTDGNALKIQFGQGKIDPQLLSEIKATKMQLIEYLTKYSTKERYENIPVAAQQEDYPLSSSQLRIWVQSQTRHGSVAYNLQSITKIDSIQNLDLLVKAIRKVIERHEVLRTVFQLRDGEVRQRVLTTEQLGFDLTVVDLSEENDFEESISEFTRSEIHTPFDLENGPLIRVNLLKLPRNEFGLVLGIHHIISDAWSLNVLSQDIKVFYDAFEKGENPVLAPLPIQYKDYTIWHFNQMKKEKYNGQRAYWLKQLSGELPRLDLPTWKQRPIVRTNNGKVLQAFFSQEDTEKLNLFCKENGGSLFMGIMASICVLFYKYTQQNDILLGTPVAGRDHHNLENQIGCYLNTLVVRNQVNGQTSFKAFYQQVRQTLLDAFSHQMYTFDHLVQDLKPKPDPSRNALIDILINLINTGDKTKKKADEEAVNTIMDFGLGTNRFDLEVTFEEVGNHIRGLFSYNTDVYSQMTIERFINHYRQLLSQLLTYPDQAIDGMAYLSEEEESELLHGFNQTEVNYDNKKTVVELFSEQVAKTPKAVALVYEGKEMTYEELNHRSNQLAHYLKKRGVKTEALVAVCLDRSLDMMVSLLGILKTGGAYVPLDPSQPQNRIQYALEDTVSKIVLTSNNYSAKFESNEGLDIILIDEHWPSIAPEPTENLEVEIPYDSLMYTMYTSGSTGLPKGVMNQYDGVVNQLLWIQEQYQLDPKVDVVLQKTTYCFDVSVLEIFWPLIVGVKMVLSHQGGEKDIAYLKQLIAKEKITMIHFVPSMLEVFLENVQVGECKELTNVICIGEPLKLNHVRLFKEKIGEAMISNLYGPTEAAIDVSFWDAPEGELKETAIPIGKPVANTQLYILDKNRQACGIGIPGELFISGVQVARGYLNRPELTAEKFANNPFIKEDKSYLYHTGDIARWRPDGNIDFLGRVDDQIKLSGYRIELGEIESVLVKSPMVNKGIVTLKEDNNGNKRLIAYVVLDQEGKEVEDTFNEEITSFLRLHLPVYMVPSIIVVLKALPLTPNGKINKKALPLPDKIKEHSKKYLPPKNVIERRMVAIIANELNRPAESIGVNENFYDIGGNSLIMIKILTKINIAFVLNLNILDLFEYPNIRSLSTYISKDVKNKEKKNRPDEDSLEPTEEFIDLIE